MFYKGSSGNWVVYGQVFDHPRFDEAEHIRTSHVLYFNPGSGIIETMNTIYALEGKPMEPQVPAAFDRRTIARVETPDLQC